MMQGEVQSDSNSPEAEGLAVEENADAPSAADPQSGTSGKHRATVANGYKWRLIIIALAGLIYGGLCVKDGAYKYPALQERRAVYDDFVAANGTDPTLWAAKARDMGWPVEEPEKIEERNILTQWVQFAIVVPIGLLHLYLLIVWSRRFVEGDDHGIRANGGRQFSWDQVTAVDAQKWDRKGIAYIEFEGEGGKDSIALDDWKMKREPADAIFALLQEHVDSDKIHGLTATPATAEADADPAAAE